MTLEEFYEISKPKLDEFVKAYANKSKENPEIYPLDLPEDNSGLWNEFYIDYLLNGTV